MMDALRLWKQRKERFWQGAIRHLRYVTNSGFLFFLVLTVLIGGYYYAQLLQALPPTFPVVELLALLFSLFLASGSVRTFIQPADQLFLLPYEGEMEVYLRRAMLYSWSFQAGIITLLLFLVGPLYQTLPASEQISLFLLWAQLLILQGVNTWMTMQEWNLRSSGGALLHRLLRWVVNGFILFFFLQQNWFWFGLWWLVLALILFIHYRRLHALPLHWQGLIAREAKMEARFYTVVNWFVDVPQLQGQVHRRRWLTRGVERLAFRDGNTYPYYLHLVFYRSHDLFPLYVRLTLVSFILLWFVPAGMMTVAIYLLAILFIAMQISPLYSRVHDLLWLRLYPEPLSHLATGYRQLVQKHVLIAALILALPVVVAAVDTKLYWLLLVPPGGWWLASGWYIKKRLNQVSA